MNMKLFILLIIVFVGMVPMAFSQTVDLSESSDTTVYSPSLDNDTPAGQAPGGPIEDSGDDSIPEPSYDDFEGTYVV